MREVSTLPEEQAFCLANEESPAFLPGFFQIALAPCKVEPQITEAFRTGKGMGWHEHDPDLFSGTFRFFRPGYNANLTRGALSTTGRKKQFPIINVRDDEYGGSLENRARFLVETVAAVRRVWPADLPLISRRGGDGKGFGCS